MCTWSYAKVTLYCSIPFQCTAIQLLLGNRKLLFCHAFGCLAARTSISMARGRWPSMLSLRSLMRTTLSVVLTRSHKSAHVRITTISAHPAKRPKSRRSPAASKLWVHAMVGPHASSCVHALKLRCCSIKGKRRTGWCPKIAASSAT